MPDWFRLDRTEGQEQALHVAAEMNTLYQQLTGWLADTGLPVLVVGDFDAAGADIEQDG